MLGPARFVRGVPHALIAVAFPLWFAATAAAQPVPDEVGERSALAPELRVALEFLAGGALEGALGGLSMLTAAEIADEPIRFEVERNGLWKGHVIVGSLAGSAGAALGVAVVGGRAGGTGQWTWTFAGAAIGGLAGALPWWIDTEIDNPGVAPLLVGIWVAFPLVGAVLGYEHSAEERPLPTRAPGLRIHAATLQPTDDLQGATFHMAGSF
jgi:hypothetical protein